MRMLCPRCRERFPEQAGRCPEHDLPLERDPFIGLQIDRWTLVDHIGEGAMGVVYSAEPRAAIKILNARRATMQPGLVRRFEVEATAASRLVSPHVARVHGSGTTEDGHLYIAMDLLSGVPLDVVVERFPRISADGVAAMAWQAGHALAEAHQKQIVHRDLKPANLFVEPLEGRRTHIRVLDFGIARINTASVARSRTGTVAGTPAYMSPEQLRGLPDIDGRTDIYSLGVVMYELLAGHNPFRGGNMMDTLRRHMEDEPPPLPADVPQALAGLVREMLHKAREDRPQSMLDVCDRLQRTGLLPSNADDTLDLQMGPLLHGRAVAGSDGDGAVVSEGPRPLRPATPLPVPSLDSMATLESGASPVSRGGSKRYLPWAAAVLALGLVAAAGAWVVVERPWVETVPSVEPSGVVDKVTIGRPSAPEVPQAVVAEVLDTQPTTEPEPTKAVEEPSDDGRRGNRPVRRKKRSDSAGSDKRLRRLLTRGNAALDEKDYATALKYYEQWLDEARYLAPPHPQIEVIRNRVGFLRDIQ